MKIIVNDKEIKIAKPCNLHQLLMQLNRMEQGIAIALNEQVVLKENWHNTIIRESDQILIIQATQGG